jgi:hypothetical protein
MNKGKQDIYQRILRTDDDAEADDDDNDDDDDDEQDGVIIPLDGNPSTARRKIKRRGSHGSSSYHSVMDNDDDDDDDDKDEQGSSVGERSPLRGTYDKDDRNDFGAPNSGGGGGGGQMTATTSRNTETTSPNNKPAVYPSLFSLYSSSFSLEDDEDDDDADLKRYALDFSIHTTDNNNKAATFSHSSLHGITESSSQTAPSLSLQQQHIYPTTARFSIVKYLWFSFQSVRQQARQRRAQLLLQQSERNWSTTLWICLMTYCDATDRGILLVVSLLLVWAILLWKIARPKGLFVTGIVLLVLRLGARPFGEFILQQRQKRRRQRQQQQQQLQQYDTSNSLSMPQLRPRLESRLNNNNNMIILTEEEMSKARYSDPQLLMDHPNILGDLPLSLSSPRNNNGKISVELSLMRGLGRTNNATTTTSSRSAAAPDKSPTLPNSCDPVIHTV